MKRSGYLQQRDARTQMLLDVMQRTMKQYMLDTLLITREYEAAIRAAWERENVMPFAAGDALELDVIAYFPIQKGTPKERRAEMELAPYLKRGDLDNIVKAVMDALNGYAYPDDAAIWNIAARKRYTNEPPVTIVTLTKK